MMLPRTCDASPTQKKKKKKESTLHKKVNIYALLLIMDLAP